MSNEQDSNTEKRSPEIRAPACPTCKSDHIYFHHDGFEVYFHTGTYSSCATCQNCGSKFEITGKIALEFKAEVYGVSTG